MSNPNATTALRFAGHWAEGMFLSTTLPSPLHPRCYPTAPLEQRLTEREAGGKRGRLQGPALLDARPYTASNFVDPDPTHLGHRIHPTAKFKLCPSPYRLRGELCPSASSPGSIPPPGGSTHRPSVSPPQLVALPRWHPLVPPGVTQPHLGSTHPVPGSRRQRWSRRWRPRASRTRQRRCTRACPG